MRYLPSLLILATLPLSSQAYESQAKQAILMDIDTGVILYKKNAYAQMPPSSMTKMMTVYLLFEQLQMDLLQMDDTFTVSKKAWKKGGSKMFVKHRSKIKIEDLIRGILVQSGNDASIVVAENLDNSVARFVKRMNAKAKELGLSKTHFTNPTGWPDKKHLSTAYDMALLSQRLIQDFPEYYHFFSEKEFTYNNIKQYNRNLILGKHGTDGLKTGHTDMGGYGVALSAKKHSNRVVAVINGLPSKKARKNESEAIIRHGIHDYKYATLYLKNTTIDQAPVWMGTDSHIALTTKEDIRIVTQKGQEKNTTITISYDTPIPAPIHTDTALGSLRIDTSGLDSKTYPLYAKQTMELASWPKRLYQHLSHWLKQQ